MRVNIRIHEPFNACKAPLLLCVHCDVYVIVGIEMVLTWGLLLDHF